MVSITVPPGSTCSYVLTSIAAPQLSCIYAEPGDSSPVHSYQRVNSGQGIVHEIEGRDAPVGFRSTSGRADAFEKTFFVQLDTPGVPVTTANTDRFAFDPIIALIEEPALPYVTLVGEIGRRWFTFPEFLTGTYTWDGHDHEATVRFTEVSTAPAVLVVDVPWSP